jgi:hypothetical protein
LPPSFTRIAILRFLIGFSGQAQSETYLSDNCRI